MCRCPNNRTPNKATHPRPDTRPNRVTDAATHADPHIHGPDRCPDLAVPNARPVNPPNCSAVGHTDADADFGGALRRPNVAAALSCPHIPANH